MLTEAQFNQFKMQFPLDSLKAAILRDSAFEQFVKNGLPTKKDEAWKYTSLSEFKTHSWAPAVTEELLTHDEMKWLSSKLSSDFYNFVFINGYLNPTLSDEFESWIEIADIAESDFQAPLPVSLPSDNVMGKEFTPPADIKLQDLAQAFLGNKIQITLPEGKVLDKPVQILFAQKSKTSVLTQPLVNIQVGKRAQMKLIQNFVSLPGQSVHALNGTLNVAMDDGSNVQFVQLQNEAEGHYHFSRTRFTLQTNAQLLTLDLGLGGHVSRHYFEVAFHGMQSFAGIYGLTALAHKQHMDHYTFIQHLRGANQSVQHYKSILTDHAHSVFRGRVRIEQDAQKANSEQLNNNLLLTREAQADSVPQLEIFADDVKAGHGSTVGQLNADELFYFLSRGISQTQAVRMLAVGYALELVCKFENPDLQKWILKNLNEKLEGMIPHV